MLVPLEKPNFDVRFDSWEDPPGLGETMSFCREMRAIMEKAYVSEVALIERLNKLARMIPDYPGYYTSEQMKVTYKRIQVKLKGILAKAQAATDKIVPAWRSLHAIYKALPTNGQAAAQRVYKGDINCLIEARRIAENGNDIPADVMRKIVEYETIICDCSKATRAALKDLYYSSLGDQIPGQPMIYKRP